MKLNSYYRYAFKICKDEGLAKDIVHDVYVHIKENMPEYIEHKGYITQAIKRRYYNYFTRYESKNIDIEEAPQIGIEMVIPFDIDLTFLSKEEIVFLMHTFEDPSDINYLKKQYPELTEIKIRYKQKKLFEKIRQYLLRTTFSKSGYITLDDLIQK